MRRGKLDCLDLKIVEALGTYGPRNISRVARKIRLHPETLRKRIRRLQSLFSLLVRASIYHTNLGLKKAFITARATPGSENLLWNALKTNGYWLYLCSCYGQPETCYGIYGIPSDNTREFKQFLQTMMDLQIVERIELAWSTCLHTINSLGTWFNGKLQTWIFPWKEWISEIQNETTNLPKTLVETKYFPQKADWIDVMILKELEKNAMVPFKDIAKMLGEHPDKIQYHFHKHVIGRELLEGFQISLRYFAESIVDSFYFTFNFHNEKTLARFASSLLDKPFMRGLGKTIGKDALFGLAYIPRSEFRNFVDALSKLISKGLLRSFSYIIEDSSKKQSQTISYEFFKDRSWTYNHGEYVKKLQELATNRSNTHKRTLSQ